MDVQSLQSILPAVLNKRGLKTQTDAARVVFLAQTWLEKALPALKDAFTVHDLKQSELHINCTHSIALQECQQIQAMLLQYLARECKGIGISGVRVLRA
jgi:hypothetical protein